MTGEAQTKPALRRWIDEAAPGTDAAAELLRRLPRLPAEPLPPAVRVRIAQRLEEAPRRSWWLPVGLGAAALGSAALLILVQPPAPPAPPALPALPALVEGPRPPVVAPSPAPAARPAPALRGEGAPEDALRLASGERAQLALGGGAQALLLGPAELVRRKDEPLLRRGRLLVRGGRQPVRVAVSTGRVTVPAAGLVEIERFETVRVAAYVGTAAWAPEGVAREIEIPAGTRLGEDPSRPERVAAEQRAAAEALLPRRHRVSPAEPAVASPSAAASAAAPEPPAGVPVPPEAPSSEAGTLRQESQLVGDALRRLQQQHDAAGALELLAQYRARFPQGTLRDEAQVALQEALVLRGEQLASAGRCHEAERDFSAALEAGAAAANLERALYGRAGCRARGGDRRGAQADLQELLRRAPGGRYADEAREALGR